jgi:hypothetical protein
MLGARRVTIRKFHTKDQQILGATVQNLVATVNCHQRFVHLWNNTPFTNLEDKLVELHPKTASLKDREENVLAFSR